MRATSQIWDDLYASNVGGLETRAVINGTEYTATSAPLITRSAMQDAMTVGNVISASCVFTIRTDNVIPKSAQVTIKSRLTDGETSSEWLPMGTFFIAKRVKDPLNGLVTLECYDALLKANSTMIDVVPWTTGDGDRMTNENGDLIYISAGYPRDMTELLDDIAFAIGIQIDERTVLRHGEIYKVPEPSASATIRDVLSMIAAANGGNFIVTPENKLRLVPVVSSAGADDTNAIDIRTFTGTISVGDARSVTGIQYTWGDSDPVLIGDATGIVVNVTLPYSQAAELYQMMNGMTYQPYSITNAWYTPAAEIGDCIKYSDRFSGVLWAETCDYGAIFTGDSSAPDFGEIDDEYPYIGASAKSLTDAKAFAIEKAEEVEETAIAATNALNQSLDQENIFNRLTNNGEEQGVLLYNGKLYINASYIRAGTMVADIIKGGMLTLGGLDNINGAMQILDRNGAVIGTWDSTGIVLNKGAISGPSIALGGENNESGTLTIRDNSGIVVGTWDKDGIYVENGSINASTLNSGTIDASVVTVDKIDASKITAGYLNAARIDANTISVDKLTGSISDNSNSWVLNLGNGTFTIGNISADNINAGHLSANYIQGGTLTLGGNNNTNGSISVKTSSGTDSGTWDNGGITIYDGKVSVRNYEPSGTEYEKIELSSRGGYMLNYVYPSPYNESIKYCITIGYGIATFYEDYGLQTQKYTEIYGGQLTTDMLIANSVSTDNMTVNNNIYLGSNAISQVVESIVQVKTVTGTTSTAGNISLGLVCNRYAVVSVYETVSVAGSGASIVQAFKSASDGDWYAHITSVSSTPVVRSEVSVTLKVAYIDLGIGGFA